jgi:hypothetical protein
VQLVPTLCNLGRAAGLVCILALSICNLAQGQLGERASEAYGWQTRTIGFGRGHAAISLGAQFGKDRFRFRNLIARSAIELGPGFRGHLGARRREGSWQKMPFHPDIDEAYLEAFRFYTAPDFELAFNLKLGRVRYLRFPEPDYLSQFDQVPGIEDLYGGPVSDYRGALFAFEAAHQSGLGMHFTGIQWAFDADQRGASAIEWYAFLRRGLGSGWSAEGRYGALMVRPEPLGRPGRQGVSAFVGKQLGDFEVGLTAEKLRGHPTYTGVLVRFRPTKITRALGTYAFDYQRATETLSVQTDVLRFHFGLSSRPAPDEELVGEVRAVRLRTFWQQGIERNEYEHRLSSWGETGGSGMRVVAQEEPWRLDLEALVSPHALLSKSWFQDRQGPAQLAQEVTYKFYRKKAR